MAQPGFMYIWIRGDKSTLDQLQNVLSTVDKVREAIEELGGFEYYDYSDVTGCDRANDNILFVELEGRWLAPIALLLFLNRKYPKLEIWFMGEEECPYIRFTNKIDESGYIVEGYEKFETFEECLKYLKDEGHIDDSEEFNNMEEIHNACSEWDLCYGNVYYSHYVTIEEIYKSLKGEEGGDKWRDWPEYVQSTTC